MTTLSPQQKRESTGDRRTAIALAARALIVEKGFEGLRTRDIAERVGINIATLHYHVPTKQALIELVCQSLRDEFRQQGLRHPKAGLSPLENLRRELADFREMQTDTPQVIQVFAELMMRSKRDESVRAVIRPLHAYWLAQFEQLFTAGVADGSFRPGLDPRSAAHMVSASLKHISAPPHTLADFDRLAAEIERAVINPNSTKKDVSS